MKTVKNYQTKQASVKTKHALCKTCVNPTEIKFGLTEVQKKSDRSLEDQNRAQNRVQNKATGNTAQIQPK